jgi:hypothetical protein
VRRAWREGVVVVGVFTVLALAATFPLVVHLGRALPGDLGDPLFTSWVLGWDAERLRHGLRGVWDAPMLFPSRNTLAFSEHMLGIAVFAAPIVWLTGNPILAYDLAFIASYVLAGFGMYLLARPITGRRDAAFLGGLAFAFGPPRALHISHLQVLASGWMPIALWGLHQYFTRRSFLALAVFAAAFSVQALSNGYFLYFLAIAVLIVVAHEIVLRRPVDADRMRLMAGLAAALAIVLVFVGVVALAYLAVRHQYGFRRPYDDWTMFSADLRSYVSVPPTVRVWSRWLAGDRAPERQLFPGLIALMLGAAALWPGRARQPMALLYAAIGAVALVLSLGPEPSAWSHRLLPSGPYLWLTRVVPGFDGLRVPARLSVLVFLSLGVLGAIGAARLLARMSRPVQCAFVSVMAVGIFVEGWAAPIALAPFDAHGRPGDRAAYRWLAQRQPGAVLELPIHDWAIAPTLTYQYATLSHGHPIVNGYSGYGSALQTFLGGAGSPLADRDQLDEALTMLRAIGVRYVLVHPRDYADPDDGVATAAAIRAMPRHVAEELRTDDVIGFRLADGAAAPPPPAHEIIRRLDTSEFRAAASDVAERLPLALDGDADTRWLTGRPQAGDEWIRLELDRPRNVARVGLQTAERSFGDYPREIVVESQSDGGLATVLYHERSLMAFGQALAAGSPYPWIMVDLPRNSTRTLTIRQTGRARRWFWSVHELGVWER